MENILKLLLNDYTFRTVAAGCTLLGTVSGILGCFAVLRRQSLLGDAVSHASLPGICGIYLLTGSRNVELLLLGGLITGLACIGLIHIIEKYSKIKFDSALAFILSVFFGGGLVLLSYLNRLPGADKAGLNRFIFGQASTFIERDIGIIFFVGIVLLVLIIAFWKELKVVSFDAEFAETLGFSGKKVKLLISVMIVVTVMVTVQVAGVVLVSALLVSPAVAARQWTDKLSVMVLLAGFLGGASGLAGTVLSMGEKGVPTGPVIVTVISVAVIFSMMFSFKRGIVFKILRNRNSRKAFIKEMHDIRELKKVKLNPERRSKSDRNFF